MEEKVAEPRQPIHKLLPKDNSELSKLNEKFDMFRQVNSRVPRDAAKFGYLEHLARVSTPLKECEERLGRMRKELFVKYSPLVNSKTTEFQELIHSLHDKVTKQDLNMLREEVKQIIYKWDGNLLSQEEVTPEYGFNWPVVYILSIKGSNYVLYTPNMTYVDGYDPFTAETKYPLIPEGMLNILKKGFYTKSRSVNIQTDQKPKKKKSISRKPSKEVFAKPLKPPKETTPQYFTKPVESQLQSIQVEPLEQAEETEEVEYSEQPQIEESEEQPVEESEESGSSSEEWEERPRFITRTTLDGVRPWEVFEKKAAEKQRARDQCADCEIM